MTNVAETLRTWSATDAAVRRGRIALGIVAFAVATAVAARVALPLPFTAVPVTFQLMVVILAGAVLGPWGGAASLSLYLAAGAAGAPVFAAGGAGLPWLLGPTGGYLLAMPAAAFAVGWIAGPRSRGVRLLAGLAAGAALIHVGGVSQLLLLGVAEPSTVFAAGVAPFLPGDVLEVLFAFLLVRTTRSDEPGAR